MTTPPTPPTPTPSAPPTPTAPTPSAHSGAGWSLRPVDGIGEVTEGTDLAALLDDADLVDGDVVVVTSKIVSKAEGRVRAGDRHEALAAETARPVARRGEVQIVENHLGLVMAAAGIDASNVAPGLLVLLPLDPDASAVRLREELHRRGVNVAVIVADTAGRAWRLGQTDIAIGAAGLVPMDDFAGQVDPYGNPLAVTAPAVADQLAGAAELTSGKLGGRPMVVVRGLDVVLPPGEHGPGARSLQRPRHQDMFALGTREAVVAAAAGRDHEIFGPAASPEEVVAGLAAAGIPASYDGQDAGVVVAMDHLATAQVVAFAFGWSPAEQLPPPTTGGEAALRLRPTP